MENLKSNVKKKKNATSAYKELSLGKVSFLFFLKYELIITLFSEVPGVLGFTLRRIFFRALFKKIGKNVVFGRNMAIRYPQKIEIGDNVVFEDNTVIDGCGLDNTGLKIGSNISIGRNTTINCKEGDIEIGDNCHIGPNNIIISESIVKMGKYVFTGSQTCIIAGGSYTFNIPDMPIRMQPSISKGGILLDDDIWIGASSTILDGVRIGKGAVIGAATLVNKRIRPYTVNVGIPSQTINKRE